MMGVASAKKPDPKQAESRAHFAQARSPRYLLPSAVLDYIEAHALYAHPGGAP